MRLRYSADTVVEHGPLRYEWDACGRLAARAQQPRIHGPQQTITVTQGTQATVVHKAIEVQSETGHIRNVAHTAIEMEAQTQHLHFKAKTDVIIEVGKSKLHMSQDGSILLEGVHITVKGSGQVDINP